MKLALFHNAKKFCKQLWPSRTQSRQSFPLATIPSGSKFLVCQPSINFCRSLILCFHLEITLTAAALLKLHFERTKVGALTFQSRASLRKLLKNEMFCRCCVSLVLPPFQNNFWCLNFLAVMRNLKNCRGIEYAG